MTDLVIILFIILLFYKTLTPPPQKLYWEDYLSKDNILVLRGLFSVVVVIHHLSLIISPTSLVLSIFKSAGGWAVMFFFFISGYGVMYNYITKVDYEKNFLYRRLIAITPIYIIAILSYWLTNYIMGNFYSIIDIIYSIKIGSPIVLHSWYIFVIIGFYILFNLEIKILKKHYKAIIVFTILLCFLWIQARQLLGFGKFWSCYIFSIPLGMIWAINKEDFEKTMQKFYYLFILIFTILFLILWKYNFGNYINTIFKNQINIYGMSIIFPILIMLLSMKLKIKNYFLELFGNISLEIYLFHGIFVNLLFNNFFMQGKEILYLLASITSTIIFSYCVHYAYSKIKTKI